MFFHFGLCGEANGFAVSSSALLYISKGEVLLSPEGPRVHFEYEKCGSKTPVKEGSFS